MIGIANIRKLKGLDNINEAYGIKDKPVKDDTKPSQPIPVKKNAKAGKKPIAKRGDKMKAVMKELKKLYPVFLAKHPNCEIQGLNCTSKATCIHHSEGRGKMQITKQSSWIPSCGPCNAWCESDHAAAKLLGFKKSKF